MAGKDFRRWHGSGIPAMVNRAPRIKIPVKAWQAMNNVKDIETAIEKLTPQEREELRQWFEEYNRPQPIDAQLKADLEAGRMDERINRALADHKAGRTQPL